MKATHNLKRSQWALSLAALSLGALALLVFVGAGTALASGGYSGGGGGDGYSGGGSGSNPTYELGKKLYQGRAKDHWRKKACLAQDPVDGVEQEPSKLSARSLRPFKGGEVIDLTTRLVDCKDPASQMAEVYSASEFQALVYYLNERFRLKLKG